MVLANGISMASVVVSIVGAALMTVFAGVRLAGEGIRGRQGRKIRHVANWGVVITAITALIGVVM